MIFTPLNKMRFTEEDMQELRFILEESEKQKDDAVLMQANRGQFHILLAKAAGNPIMEMFMQSLIELLREYFYDFKSVDFESHTKACSASMIYFWPKPAMLLKGEFS